MSKSTYSKVAAAHSLITLETVYFIYYRSTLLYRTRHLWRETVIMSSAELALDNAKD
jgi:hypothetical protein